jgi:hypothetical protein
MVTRDKLYYKCKSEAITLEQLPECLEIPEIPVFTFQMRHFGEVYDNILNHPLGKAFVRFPTISARRQSFKDL